MNRHSWTTCRTFRTCSARGSRCSCAAARGPTTLCATSRQTWCSLMRRRATAQSAQPCGTTLPPEVMQIALRRRLRLRLPLGPATCGQEGHGCGRRLDAWGDHALACPSTGYLAKRAKLVERAWIAVCRDAVGPEGHVVPQQWLTHTSAPGVLASDRRRLDLVVYGASSQSLALCCDATLVSPVTSEAVPHPRAEHTAGVALLIRSFALGGGQRLCVLATDVGGQWSRDAHELVRQLVRVRALRAPALRACASAAWARRWWGILSVAVQHAAHRGCFPGERSGKNRPWIKFWRWRPQPPANALSMVFTARSTARCTGHKLLLGARKKTQHILSGQNNWDDAVHRAWLVAASTQPPHGYTKPTSVPMCRPSVIAAGLRRSGDTPSAETDRLLQSLAIALQRENARVG